MDLIHTPNLRYLLVILNSIITRSSTSQTRICLFARTCSYFNSFVPHTICSWNLLPTTVTSINSIVPFKLNLQAHIYISFCYLCALHIYKNFHEKKKKKRQKKKAEIVGIEKTGFRKLVDLALWYIAWVSLSFWSQWLAGWSLTSLRFW